VRKIEVEEGLRVRFPGREAEFANGVEIGILLAQMGMRQPVVAQRIAAENVDQARTLAEKLGYRLVVDAVSADTVRVTLTAKGIRPKLKVVSTA
jgi:hypothetical protein